MGITPRILSSPTAPAAVANVLLERVASGVRLLWDPHADPCASFRVLSSATPDQGATYQTVVEGLILPAYVHTGVLDEGTSLRSWLVQAVSPLAGDGDLGHFGQ